VDAEKKSSVNKELDTRWHHVQAAFFYSAD
jgi:hypothetical protein